jgi:hypothetical protein
MNTQIRDQYAVIQARTDGFISEGESRMSGESNIFISFLRYISLRNQSRSSIRIGSLCLVSALLSAPIATHADYFIDGEGKEQPFCEAILVALNSSNPTDEHRPCIPEEIFNLPGVKDPAWERLDLSQHEELAKKLYVLNSVGSAEYFRAQKLMPHMYPSPEQQQRFVDEMQNARAKLFVLRLPPEFFGDQVLVTLLYRKELCGWPAQPRGDGDYNAWVTSDLKEIGAGPGIFDSRAGRPLVYHNKLYVARFYGTDQELEIFVPRRMYIGRICNIGFSSTVNSKGEPK